MKLQAQVPTTSTLPVPEAGQSGAKIQVTPVAPPSADKFTMLLGIGLWAATAALIGYGMYAGVQFAKAYSEGHAGRSEKFLVVAVAIGAVITAAAASFVSFFMG